VDFHVPKFAFGIRAMLVYLVDAFTAKPFRGNPAGVCIVEEFPSSCEMQKLSTYYNWSEISFVKCLSNNRFHIRWFSPADEAPLCGHATIAAAHVLFSQKLAQCENIIFEYNSGTIQAILNNNNSISISFPIKPIHTCSDVPFSIREIIEIEQHLEILKDDSIYVIVLNSADDVIRAVPNFDAIKKIDARAIAITGAGNGDFDFSSRYFAPRVGIYEDPVCGSMHCRLAYYWKFALNKLKFRAFQASHRSGVLDVEVIESQTPPVVRISGDAILIGKFRPLL
jgi:PhzF family phenazine biosynthesis protein